MALPLITTSVTRHVKVDLHVAEKQEEKEEHDSHDRYKLDFYCEFFWKGKITRQSTRMLTSEMQS